MKAVSTGTGDIQVKASGWVGDCSYCSSSLATNCTRPWKPQRSALLLWFCLPALVAATFTSRPTIATPLTPSLQKAGKSPPLSNQFCSECRLVDSPNLRNFKQSHPSRKPDPTNLDRTDLAERDRSSTSPDSGSLDLPPNLPQNSPVLRRWLQEIPDLQTDIRRDPAFRTRVRVGYSYFFREEASGFSLGVEDVFLGRTGLTLSADYQQAFLEDVDNQEGDLCCRTGGEQRQIFGADLRYYVLPLGSYLNLAPVVGYRHIETPAFTTDGLHLGLRLMLSLSRTGAADVSLTQTWVSPGTDEEVGITTLSAGYALTRHLRLSTDLQKQNAPQSRDSRVGVLLEWML